MAYVMRNIHSFVIIALCLNFIAACAGERSFNPYSRPSSSSSFSLQHFEFNKAISGMKNFTPAPLLVLLNNSFMKMHDGYDLALKIIADNPKQVSAAAAMAIVLGLMWYKSEAVKQFFKSEKFAKYGEKIVGCRDAVVQKVDDKIISNIPYPFYPVAVALRGLIGFLFNKIIAMDGEYAVGACMSPLIGYINGYTPLAALGGVKVGCAVAGMFLLRGWIGIDAAEVKRAVGKVERKVDGVQESLDSGQVKAAEHHQEALDKIKELDDKIGELSLEIKQGIEASNRSLSEQMGLAATQAEESREVLLQKIELVHKELAEQVSQLPSKQDNKDVVDEAMAKVVKKFEECIASSVKALDEKTELKLEAITQQLQQGFEKIDGQQNDQAQKIKELADKVSVVIDEREQDIRTLTELVDTTKLSNKTLLEKFEFIEGDFKNTQEAFRKSDERYSQLLDAKTQDWQRLEIIINEQITGFGTLNQKLSELQSKIERVDEKTDTQYGVLTSKIDDVISLFQKELAKVKEEATLREQAYLEKISVLEKAQKEHNDRLELFREDFNDKADKMNKGQKKILKAVQNNGQAKPQITFGSDERKTRNISYQNNNQLPYQVKQLTSDPYTAQINWRIHADQNNGEDHFLNATHS